MKNLFTRAAILFNFVTIPALAFTQDIIVKNDKSEVKSKVQEISETSIKYKKWENLDGPLYSLNKSDVFMIMYANGQREIMKASTNTTVVPAATANVNGSQDTKSIAWQMQQQAQVSHEKPALQPGDIDTTIDYQNIKVKYKPTRFVGGLEQPLTLGVEREFRIVKNLVNLGTSVNYIFHPAKTGVSTHNFYFIYGSLYAPVNRLTGNFEKQDKGLFLFGHGGYGGNFIRYTEGESVSDGAFTWRFGMDYYFSKRLGITFSSYEFTTFYGGISIAF